MLPPVFFFLSSRRVTLSCGLGRQVGGRRYSVMTWTPESIGQWLGPRAMWPVPFPTGLPLIWEQRCLHLACKGVAETALRFDICDVMPDYFSTSSFSCYYFTLHCRHFRKLLLYITGLSVLYSDQIWAPIFFWKLCASIPICNRLNSKHLIHFILYRDYYTDSLALLTLPSDTYNYLPDFTTQEHPDSKPEAGTASAFRREEGIPSPDPGLDQGIPRPPRTQN